ncbi:MAG: hypothetical protein KIH64_003620 [Mycobacterium sp.]|nr:hypothetical protein [Mycobacterium sp.]
MSRNSQAKQARRKKRQAARAASWIPQPLLDEASAAAESDPVAEALADIDEWLSDRGWVFDDENSKLLVSWVYPPSAAESDDGELEPVTRIWLTLEEDDEAVVLEFGATLVGDGGDEESYVLNPDSLEECVAALESYRPGMARPELD